MGSFPGHAVPGSFFFVFGLWYTVQMFHRYYQAIYRNSKFTSSAIFNCRCLCGRFKDWPIEAYFKLFFSSVGIFIEVNDGLSRHWPFISLTNAQHATMFFAFGLTGVVDILLHYKFLLPPNMDYVSLIMALVVELVIFRFHTHGREDLDVLVHTLLVYTIAAGIIAVILEAKYRTNITCALSRAYFLLLQGTWFWQVGWILYPPFENSHIKNLDDHNKEMLATMLFTWHATVNILIMLSIGGTVLFVQRKLYSYKMATGGFAMKELIGNTSTDNGESTLLMNGDDSENEI